MVKRSDESAGDSPFPRTRWTVVQQAAAEDETVRRRALEELCAMYWKPLYIFVRCSGNSQHDAEDLTQEFLATLLERNDFAKVSEEKGRLRTFLLTALRNFIINQKEKSNRLKRGGGVTHFPIDPDAGEDVLKQLPSDGLSPEIAYHRLWADTLFENVSNDLGDKYRQQGKARIFDALRVFLTPDQAPTYELVAAGLGLTTANVKSMVYRLRQQYGRMIRREVAETLMDGEDIDEEMKFLVGVFSAP